MMHYKWVFVKNEPRGYLDSVSKETPLKYQPIVVDVESSKASDLGQPCIGQGTVIVRRLVSGHVLDLMTISQS